MSSQEQYDAAVRALASRGIKQAIFDEVLQNHDVLARFGIDTPLKEAHFLSQTAHESGGFNILAENLRYTSGRRLMEIWPNRFPDEAATEPFVNNPEALANSIYANRLGNGPVDSGDGYHYRGRGLLQLTGRANYAAVAKISGLPLEEQPDLAGEPKDCLLIACAAWKHIGAAALPETASVETYTRKVNGGVVGLDDRKTRFETARKALGL